ncbi:MAG: DMT family transporter [Alphaproteobacteria bacterium]|nr:DMT family transporter [Alphaproteobacteria bacterium]MCB9699783.1 DMT family transporter [Alphaproteobacteria bacterium]
MLSVGIACALLAPLCWSVAVLFYRRSADLASPVVMTVFKNAVAAALLVASAAVLGTSFPWERSWVDWLRLAASGVLGLAVADTLLFEALRRVGAARIAITDTSYAPSLLLLSWWFLDERLSTLFFVGAGLVLAGVAMANLKSDGDQVDRRDLTVGTLLGLGAVAGTVVGVILSKPVLEDSDLVEVTLTRMLAGLALQVPWALWRGMGPELAASLTRRDLWKTLFPAAFVGTWLSLLLWMAGFKWAPASVAAVLNQMATVYILVLARVVLKEQVGWRQALGGLTAAAGALVVVLGSR